MLLVIFRIVIQSIAVTAPVAYTIVLSASLRNRLPSETRVDVCLIPGPVFILWQATGNPDFTTKNRLFARALQSVRFPFDFLVDNGDGNLMFGGM